MSTGTIARYNSESAFPVGNIVSGFGRALLALAALVGVDLWLSSPGFARLLLCSAVVLVFGCWMMHQAVGLFRLRQLTVPGFCYLVYCVMVFLPALAVYTEQVEPFRTAYIIAVESALLTIPAGVLLVNYFTGFRKAEITGYFKAPMARPVMGPNARKAFLLFFLVALVLCAAHVAQMPTVPMLYMLQHPNAESITIALMREQAVKLLDSPLRYAYEMVAAVFLPFLVLVALGSWLAYRTSQWRALALSTALVAVLYAAMTTARLPVAMVIVLVLIFLYLYRGGKVHTFVLIGVPLLGLAYPFFVDYSMYPQLGVATLLIGTVQRLFHSPANVLYYYFAVFPSVVPYQHGATIGKLALLMGIPSFPAANAVGLFMDPQAMDSISANAPFIGNLHADFGLPGVVLGAMAAGAIMQGVQIYLVRRPKTAVSLSLYSFCLLKFSFINLSNLAVTLLSDGALSIFLLAWLLWASEGTFDSLDSGSRFLRAPPSSRSTS